MAGSFYERNSADMSTKNRNKGKLTKKAKWICRYMQIDRKPAAHTRSRHPQSDKINRKNKAYVSMGWKNLNEYNNKENRNNIFDLPWQHAK